MREDAKRRMTSMRIKALTADLNAKMQASVRLAREIEETEKRMNWRTTVLGREFAQLAEEDEMQGSAAIWNRAGPRAPLGKGSRDIEMAGVR
jgi:hypothetical protein